MSCCIEIDERGIATVEIADAEGELHSYSIERAPAGLSDAAFALTRLDSQECYRVELFPSGRWRCSCPSWKYRRGGEHPHGCKHTSALTPLYRFLSRLMETARVEHRVTPALGAVANSPAAPEFAPVEFDDP